MIPDGDYKTPKGVTISVSNNVSKSLTLSEVTYHLKDQQVAQYFDQAEFIKIEDVPFYNSVDLTTNIVDLRYSLAISPKYRSVLPRVVSEDEYDKLFRCQLVFFDSIQTIESNYRPMRTIAFKGKIDIREIYEVTEELNVVTTNNIIMLYDDCIPLMESDKMTQEPEEIIFIRNNVKLFAEALYIIITNNGYNIGDFTKIFVSIKQEMEAQ